MTGKKYGKDIDFNFLVLYNEDIIKLLDLLLSSFESNLKTKDVKYAVSISIKLFKDVSYTYDSKEDFVKDFNKFNKVRELQIHIYDNIYEGNSVFLRMDTHNGLLFNGGYISISSNDENWHKLLIYDFNNFLKENLGIMGKTPKKILSSIFSFFWVFSLTYSFTFFALKVKIPTFVSLLYIIILLIVVFLFVVYECSGNRLYFNHSRKKELYTLKSFMKWLGSQTAGVILGIVLTALITLLLKLFSK